jgi:hypothetical protein
VDGAKNTVLMVQVENEIGMLPVAREYGEAAERSFHDTVPEELVRAISSSTANPESALVLGDSDVPPGQNQRIHSSRPAG